MKNQITLQDIIKEITADDLINLMNDRWTKGFHTSQPRLTLSQLKLQTLLWDIEFHEGGQINIEGDRIVLTIDNNRVKTFSLI